MRSLKVFLVSLLLFYSQSAISNSCSFHSLSTMSACQTRMTQFNNTFCSNADDLYPYSPGQYARVFNCSQPITGTCSNRNITTGECPAPSQPCVAGEKKTILVKDGSYPVGSPPTFKLTQDKTAVQEVLPTVTESGCVFTLPANPNQKTDCQMMVMSDSAKSGIYCRQQATMTGGVLLGADTAFPTSLVDTTTKDQCGAEWDETNKRCKVPTSKVGCYNTQFGDEICPSKPEKNCGDINGVSVCFKDNALNSNGYPASIVNGQVVASKTNVNGQVDNCALDKNGRPICINLPVQACGPGTAFVCAQTEPVTTGTPSTIKPSITVPISADAKSLSKTATVTNADGSKTVTTTTTTNIVNSTPTVKTETFSSTGVLTSTGYSQGDSNGKGVTDNVAAPLKPNMPLSKGQWYVSDGTRTFSSVATPTLNKLKSSPVFKFGKDIFNVTIPSGECPVIHIPTVMGLPETDISAYCDPAFQIVWDTIAAVLKICAVMISFRMIVSIPN